MHIVHTIWNTMDMNISGYAITSRLAWYSFTRSDGYLMVNVKAQMNKRINRSSYDQCLINFSICCFKFTRVIFNTKYKVLFRCSNSVILHRVLTNKVTWERPRKQRGCELYRIHNLSDNLILGLENCD